MKGIKRVISALIAVCMIAVMLPAQIALATEQGNMDDYIHGRVNSIENVPEGYKGHIFQYEDFSSDDSKPYDYKITVYARNMTASQFYTSFMYDKTDVTPVTYASGTAYDESFGGDLTVDLGDDSFFEYGTVTNDMVSSSGSSLVGKSINEAGVFTKAEASDSAIYDGEGSYVVLYKIFLVANLATPLQGRWVNDGTGAKYQPAKLPNGEAGSNYMYAFPGNKTIKMYSMFFKKASDSAEIDSDTFKPSYEINNTFHAGAGAITEGEGVGSGKKSAVLVDEGVYLAGFPTPQASPVKLNFTVQDNNSQPIENAEIGIFTDENCTVPAQLSGENITGKTAANGTASITVPANSSYYYKITGPGGVYLEHKDLVAVDAADKSVDTVTLYKPSEKQYKLTVTVKNGDTEEPVEGATVKIDGVAASGTTDGSGQLVVNKPNGTYSITAEKGTEFTADIGVNVTINNADIARTVNTIPKRASLTLPQVKDSQGEVVPGAKFTISLKNGTAIAWGSSISAEAGSTAQVPANCEFEITLLEPADYKANTFYAVSLAADSPATLYSDSTHSSVISGSEITADRMDEPVYTVTVEKNETDNNYKATVKLKNIRATYGTFGLRYDADVFALDNTTGVELASTIEEFPGDESEIATTAKSDPSDEVGYYVFKWQAKKDESGIGVLDTTAQEEQIAVFTFTLKPNMSDGNIGADILSVMPFDKTKEGVDFMNSDMLSGSLNEGTWEVLNGAWRYCDNENNPDTLGAGRIDSAMATDRGFYQVYNEYKDVPSDDSLLGVMSDVRTVFDYKIELNTAGLVFEIEDKDKIAIDGTEITLSGGDLAEPEILTTNVTGTVDKQVDVTNGDVTYDYSIHRNGYWDKTGTVTVKKSDPLEITYVHEELEEKIYHEPQLVSSNDSSAIEAGVAELSGDPLGYNGRDYLFNISVPAGKKYTVPEKLTVEINNKTYDVPFSKKDNMFKLDKQYIEGTKNDNALSSTEPINPNENGFKSYPIIVKINPDDIKDNTDKYTVTAMAGTHGAVEYTPADGSTGTKDDSASNGTNVVINDVTAGSKVGEFKFTPENDKYKVEKVIINGVEVLGYKDAAEVTYTFDNVMQDSNITVIFYDGITPSEDAVITLAVGDRGTAKVSAPAPAADVKNTRKTYLLTGETNGITFETEADTGYELNAVEKQINRGEKTDITNGTSYTVTADKSQNVVVYVSFKAEGEEDTFNVFVTAYVESGEGTIAPVGVSSYNKNDSPKFTLTASEVGDWMASGVKVNDAQIDFEQTQTKVYQLISLQSDTSIGAIFTERAYKVIGIVDLAQGASSPLASANPQRGGATVTFHRVGDAPEADITVTSQALRQNAKFEAGLAKGTWTVTVHKKGYVDYVITDYVVGDDAKPTMYFGATESKPNEAKPIVPYIGNTNGKGLSVSLSDAGTISSALRPNVNAVAKLIADVDDDGRVNVSDLSYTKDNYGKRKVTKTYKQFLAE